MSVELMPAGSKQPKEKRSYAWIPAVLAVLLCASGSVWFLTKGYGEYKEMADMQVTWSEIQDIADADPIDERDKNEEFIVVDAGDHSEPATEAETEPEGHVIKVADVIDDPLYKTINLQGLMNLNSDVSGYIYIPNTPINYPILKEPVEYEYFYLGHNFNKELDKYGSIFEINDYERGLPNIDNAVNVIFGHHMASGAMFSGLYNYYNEDTREKFKTNPIYVYRRDCRIEYRVSAVCIVDKNDPVYVFDNYPRGSEEYKQLIARLKSESKVQFDYPMPASDEDMLILSTCYGSAGTSNRLIVICTEYRKAIVPDSLNTDLVTE